MYEPLLINADLLFALGDKLEIGEKEQKKIDAILHENGEALFLIPSFDNTYRYAKVKEERPSIELKNEGEQIVIPACYLSENVEIKVSATYKNEIEEIDDWTLEEVKREKGKDVSTFKAYFKNEKAKKTFKIGTKIFVTIYPNKDYEKEKYEYTFETFDAKTGFANILFWNPGKGFKEIK